MCAWDDIKPISSCESQPKRVRNIQLQKLLLTEVGWPGSDCLVLPLVQTAVLWRRVFLPALPLSFRASAQICPEVRKEWREHLHRRDRNGGGWKVAIGRCLGTSLRARASHGHCPSAYVQRAPTPTPQPPPCCLAADLGMKLVLMLAERLLYWSVCGLITIITWARRDDRWDILNPGLSLFQLTIWLLPGSYSSDLFSAVSIQGFWPLTPPCENIQDLFDGKG